MNIERLRSVYAESYTHHYIMGADDGEKVRAYFVDLSLEELAFLFSDKPTQSKRAVIVKYRSTKPKREMLKAKATRIVEIGSSEQLKAKRRIRVNRKGKQYKENCGECFEWLLAELFGAEQNEKANLKHTDGGDLVIEGIAYQVKYERAGIAVG